MKKASSVGAVCGNDSSFTSKTDHSVTDGINSEHEHEQRQSSKDAEPARRRRQQASWRTRSNARQHECGGGALSHQPTPDRRVRLTHQADTTPTGYTTSTGRSQLFSSGRATQSQHSSRRRNRRSVQPSQGVRTTSGPWRGRQRRNTRRARRERRTTPSSIRSRGTIMGAEVKNLQQELSRVKEVVRGRAPDTMDTLVQQTESPFTAEVLHFPLPAKFRMPQVEAFDGVKDPVDHLNTYKNQMDLHGYQDPVRCRAFAITLKGPALAWFNRLPPSSISSFRELSIAFVSHFIGARTYRKPSYHLLTIKQGSQESLRSYVQRFNAESLKLNIPDEKFAITAFIAGLGVQSKDLMFSISKNPQASMAEVLAKSEKYINGEEALISKKESSSTHKEKSGTDKRRGRSPKGQSDRERSPRKGGERSPKRRGNLRDRLGPPQFERRRRYSPQRFTPLTALVSQVLREVRNEQFLRWPTHMKSDPTTRDNTKYFEFHKDYGHRTDDCIQLKREIEYLIWRGYLRRFISPEN